jgi:hypothetical protein
MQSKECRAYNLGEWLILQDIFNEWVAEGVASDPHDFNVCNSN